MDLRKCILTKNECYQRGVAMKPKGIVWHSTGANNTSIGRYVPNYDGKLKPNKYDNHWDNFRPGGRQVCVHAFIGKDKDNNICTYQTLPFDMVGWHVGGKGNNDYIGFEICEDDLTNKDYFDKVYKEAVEFTAHLCQLYNLDPKGKNVIICHQDAYKLGIGSNHSDVYHWFNKFGKTMQNVRDDVYALLNDNIEDYSGYVTITYIGSDGLDLHTKATFDGYVAKVAKKGEVYEINGRVKVSGVYMYRLTNGYYVTASPTYIKYTEADPRQAVVAIKINDKVKIKSNAKKYANSTKSIPAWVKLLSYTVAGISEDKTKVRLSVINSWVYAEDVDVVKSATTSSAIKVGDMVGVKSGVKDYNGNKAGGVKRGVVCYRVDELKGKRAVLDKDGICTPFHVDNLFK